MSSSIVLSSSHMVEAIRFVSLPKELQTPSDVAEFVSSILMLGTVSSVNIVPMQTTNGVRYRSAFVDIETWSENSGAFQEKLLSSEQVISGADLPAPIHFDNGKPMSHIKVTVSKKHGLSKTPLVLEDGAWSSIYIPVIPSDLGADRGDVRYVDEASFAELFEDHLMLGQISRIDFVVKQAPGSDQQIRSAYVHFDHWYENKTTSHIRQVINNDGEFRCSGFYDGFEFRRFDHRRFISFKINHKPIPAAPADMNIHQLAAAKDFLDKKVEELEKENEALKARLVEVNQTRSVTVAEAFEQLRSTMEAIKLESETNPDFKEVDFDYVEATKELYDMYVPVIWR
jgi:hypothetical protein